MKRYTVYQIEKMTGGKLSKYKLTRAIQTGELRAESVLQTKKGRGTANYYIVEEDLKAYIKKVEMTSPSDFLEEIKKKEKTIFEEMNQKIDKIRDHLKTIETQQSKLIPVLQEQKRRLKDEAKKSEQRRTLLMELASVPAMSLGKRQEILGDLIKLS